MLIATKNILDHEVRFHVNYEGKFSADVQGSDEHLVREADTLKRAVRLARMELKKKQIRVSVPFTTTDFRPAIARGRHARQRYRILIWVDDGTTDGKNDYIDAYSYTSHYPVGGSGWVLEPDLSQKALNSIKYLHEQRTKTQERLTKIENLIERWVQKHSFNLSEAVDIAIAEAAQEQAEDDADTDDTSDTNDEDQTTTPEEES